MAVKKRSPKKLSPRSVETLKSGVWLTDDAHRGAGRLQARRAAGGSVAFYYRYTDPQGVQARIPIGTYAVRAGEGEKTLNEARRKAEKLSRRYQDGDRDLRGTMDRDSRERQAEQDAEARQQQANESRKAGTLGVLLTAYCDHLKKQGKISESAVRSMLVRHVEQPHPALWRKPAADTTPEDGVAILSALVEVGKMREAGKLRAAMRASFGLAIRSHADPAAPASLRKLGLRANPFADLAAIAGGSGARERALSVDELRAYWRALNKLREPDRSLLRFHLLTGGQRIEQLARAELPAWDRDANTLTLLDPKGRRTQPRRHPVPLLPEAVESLEGMAPERLGPHMFTITAGQTGCSYASASARLRELSAALVKAREVSASFTLGDIRRTVETRLASLGVSRETRARLQSHGLGGVQSRHYDKHDYLSEMRTALEQLRSLVISLPAKVTPIRQKKSGASR